MLRANINQNVSFEGTVCFLKVKRGCTVRKMGKYKRIAIAYIDKYRYEMQEQKKYRYEMQEQKRSSGMLYRHI
jgi:hypothetical protein